ncbi:hypothetical protein [Cohnella hashimotonis]|uniref:Uncharacterized protein n=1 Tax=Cohnella hashimotonis TaxID=2826895 RepID=A0ABT6TMP1_9BACL|nr:hypothetical protein [Cohnella hashimotonis]MDI4648075.1 hypothetical protein [Cohnella hashimotonis]
MDYLNHYYQEAYIFGTVHSRFEAQGFLTAYDFFCIIIWKANRAKTKIAKRLLKSGSYANLDEAVIALTSGINEVSDHKNRLRLLMMNWGFQLPMATAILTVLYPDDFTVYDIRVCNELNGFHNLKNMVSFESIWSGFLSYKQQVELVAPTDISLRDKDRYLWGRSFASQLENDIARNFLEEEPEDE